MTFTISFGPEDDRRTEQPVNIIDAANRYRELQAMNAIRVEVQRDGERLDPRLLLAASPAIGRITRRA